MDVFSGKTHIVMGLTIGLLVVEKLKIPFDTSLLLYIGGVYVGTLFPDSDHERAPMGKIIPLWLFLKHRTLTHSIFIFLLPIILVKIMPQTFYFSQGLFVGIASHLVLDMLNPTGCPLLYPMIKGRINIAWLKTGSLSDDILFFVFLIGFSAISYKMFFM